MSGRIFALLLGSLVLIGVGAGAGLSRVPSLACLAVGALGFGVALYLSRSGGDR